jgi:LysR family transcriptional regulator of gallate degradation
MVASTTERLALSTSLRHLKVFDSVAHRNGLRRASDECHISQPAVSQAIAKLEEQLGVPLFERRTSGSYLNQFGMIFHRRSRRLFEQFEQALVEIGAPTGSIPAPQLAARISKSQIRSLIAIVENGSFAQAARAVEVSQTSLQRAARDLERTLRVSLYAQAASGIIATPAAAVFARKIKLALREIEYGFDEVQAARGSVGGSIDIGAMLLAGSEAIASVIDEFARTYPNAHVRMLNGNADDMFRCLRAGDVDMVIGLLKEQASEGLVHRALVETSYVIVGRRGHPLAGNAGVTLDDLANYDWIVGTPGAIRRSHFDRLFAGRRAPSARIATCSLPTVRLLMAQSNRLTLLTSYELSAYDDDSLAAIPYGPDLPLPWMGLTMREGWLPTRLQSEFIELIQKHVMDPFEPVPRPARSNFCAPVS